MKQILTALRTNENKDNTTLLWKNSSAQDSEYKLANAIVVDTKNNIGVSSQRDPVLSKYRANGDSLVGVTMVR